MTPDLPLFELPLNAPPAIPSCVPIRQAAELDLPAVRRTSLSVVCFGGLGSPSYGKNSSAAHLKEPPTAQPEPAEQAETSAFQKLEQLSRQIREMETAGRPDKERISSGCRTMDRHLPGGGYARGSMLELLRSGPGTGLSSLALMMARQAIVEGKYLVLVDPQRQFYPPALKSLGIPLERVIALQPANHADAIWGLAQVLRCPAVGAVIAEIGTLEDRAARKLQLAAEEGGGLGLFLRDARSARTQPSWADVQWLVRSASLQDQNTRWFHLELARCSGGRTGARLTVGVNSHGQWIDAPTTQGARHEHASALHLAAQLAQPTRHRRDIAG